MQVAKQANKISLATKKRKSYTCLSPLWEELAAFNYSNSLCICATYTLQTFLVLRKKGKKSVNIISLNISHPLDSGVGGGQGERGVIAPSANATATSVPQQIHLPACMHSSRAGHHHHPDSTLSPPPPPSSASISSTGVNTLLLPELLPICSGQV